MCYTLTKSFHKNPTCRVTCVKKTKFNAENKTFQEINFLFFTTLLQPTSSGLGKMENAMPKPIISGIPYPRIIVLCSS